MEIYPHSVEARAGVAALVGGPGEQGGATPDHITRPLAQPASDVL